MSKRVTNVVVEFCKLTVYYSDCTNVTYDISNCGDKTPEEKKPGDWPPPDPVTDVQCRVAIKVGQQTAERLNNYLSGLILTNPAANLVALYTSVKIAEYGWPIALYDPFWQFYYDSIFPAEGGTPGFEAKQDWDANSAAIIAAVQEALYCSLPSSGEITETTREIWVAALNGMATDFTTILGALLLVWPLAQLREMAFNASVTTDAVDCEDFDCGGSPSGDPCAGIDIVWSAIGATPSQWQSLTDVDTSGWEGDVSNVENCGTGSVNYGATRSANTPWNVTGAQNVCLGLAIKYTLDVPCVITHAAISFNRNSGNSLYVAIAARRASDGVYVILEGQARPALQPLSGALVWTGDPIAVSEVMYIFHSGNSSGAASINVTRCELNHPEP